MQKTISTIKSLIIVFALTIGMSYVFANWTAPLSTPPDCIAGNPGCDAPINVGNVEQTKLGKFNLGTITVPNPLAKLDVGGIASVSGLLVNGSVTILGGSPGLGKVLTSDATGLASWQTSTGTGGGTRIVAAGVCINGRTDQFNSESILSGGATCSGYTGAYNSGTIASVTCPSGTTKIVVATQKNYNQGGEGAICVQDASGGGATGAGGVSKIIAGTGITVSPIVGTGDVTVSSTKASCGWSTAGSGVWGRNIFASNGATGLCRWNKTNSGIIYGALEGFANADKTVSCVANGPGSSAMVDASAAQFYWCQ